MRVKAIENYLDSVLHKTVLRDEVIEVDDDRAVDLAKKCLVVMLDKPKEEKPVEKTEEKPTEALEKAPKPKRKKSAE